MTRVLTRVLAVTALAALAACSGGGGALPQNPSAGTPGTASVGHATLTITRLNPAAPSTSETAAHRSARELSSASNSVVVDSTGASPTHSVYDISGAVLNGVNCGADASGIYQHCTMQVRLPLGPNTLNVSTNSARDGSGTTLDSATTTITIVDAQDNPIAMTLNGVVASMKLFAGDPAPPTGSTSSIPLSVQLYDATGTLLLAPQNYTQPIVVTDTDTSANSTLYTVLSQNSTQRYTGTGVSTSPSASSKTVNVPDRYTQPFLSYNGTGAAAITVTATYGSLTASVTVTPSAPAARPAGANGVTHILTNTVRSYDPIFDATGHLWTTQTGGKFASIDTTTSAPTFTVTGTYLPAGVASGARALRSPVLGPDNKFYMVAATVTNGAATAPYYVVQFDPATHVFTDIPTPNDEVLHLTVANGSIVGAERNASKVWILPFSGTTPGTPSEFSVSVPAGVPDTTPVLLPLPTRVFPSGDGNLLVVLTSYASVDGTYIAKYSPSGTKLSETLVDAAHPTDGLDAQAYDAAHNTIWFVSIRNLNEFERYDVGAGTLTTVAVPRLYGENSFNEFTAYEALDGAGNLFFISYLDGRIGRVDRVTNRAELVGPFSNGNIYGMVLGPDTQIYFDGFNNSSQPYVFTTNTQ